MPSVGDSKGTDDNDLGEGATVGCTERCTDAAESSSDAAPAAPTDNMPIGRDDRCAALADDAGARPDHVAPPELADTPAAKTDADSAGDGFGEALTLIARLPLTDAEKAEAVRRLLTEHAARGKA